MPLGDRCSGGTRGASFRPAISVIDLIDEVARAWPEAVALSAGGSRYITYHALMTAADTLAAELVALGAGADSPVGICIDRSIEHVIAMLGALRAGACFLPLDPDWPSARLSSLLADADASIVIAAPRLMERVAAPNRIVLNSAPEARRHARAGLAEAGERKSRLYYLHLRLDRRAERRRDHASQSSPSGRLASRSVRHLGAGPGELDRGPRLRRVDLGSVSLPRRGRVRSPTRRLYPWFGRGLTRLAGREINHHRLRANASRGGVDQRDLAGADRASHPADRWRHLPFMAKARIAVPCRQ